MDRERIGLQARLYQLGRHKPARRLAEFEAVVRLLRKGVLFGWLRAWPLVTFSAGWLVLLSASVVFYLFSLLLSASERLIRNRWMSALRHNRRDALSDHLIGFSLRDVPLAVRVAVFYRTRLLGRALLLFALPVLLTAAGLVLLDSGASREVLTGGAVCLLLLWLAALFFFLTARGPLLAAASLLTDPFSFAQRKSILARLDKNCFLLAKFSLHWALLPCGVRFQAKAIYASLRR